MFGYLVFLGKSLISWKTKKQPIVARSFAEAEDCVVAVTTCEWKWLKSLLYSHGILHPKPIQLFCDSQSTTHIAKIPILHDCMEHIEVDCHFVHDDCQLDLQYYGSSIDRYFD